MLQKNIKYMLTFFILSIGWQFFFQDGIRWGESAAVSLLAFLFAMFYDWANIPYKWKGKQ